MSEPIPESIPTSADPRSKRPTKKRALTPNSAQASQVEALFAKPDREIHIPDSSTGKKSSLAPPPEIVANVQGSSAGAGSGEFHVYKASRRREYERLRTMEEEVRKEKEDQEYLKAREEREKQDAAKTNKNKKRREKLRQRQQKAKEALKGSSVTPVPEDEKMKDSSNIGNKLQPNPNTKSVSKEAKDGEDGEDAEADAVASNAEIGIIIHDDD